MKKRIIALLLALLMLISAGCGSAPAAKEPADEEPALGAYQAGAPEPETAAPSGTDVLAAIPAPKTRRKPGIRQ